MHYLEQFKMILQVSVDVNLKDQDKDQAIFIFYNHTTFLEIQRLPVLKKHYTCAMTANDMRKEETKAADDGFFAVLFTHNDHLDAYQLVKFTLNPMKKWQLADDEVKEE